MKVGRAYFGLALPAGDKLDGIIFGHWPNGKGNLRDFDTDTMVMPHVASTERWWALGQGCGFFKINCSCRTCAPGYST